jgi:hypothetical protein
MAVAPEPSCERVISPDSAEYSRREELMRQEFAKDAGADKSVSFEEVFARLRAKFDC